MFWRHTEARLAPGSHVQVYNLNENAVTRHEKSYIPYAITTLMSENWDIYKSIYMYDSVTLKNYKKCENIYLFMEVNDSEHPSRKPVCSQLSWAFYVVTVESDLLLEVKKFQLHPPNNLSRALVPNPSALANGGQFQLIAASLPIFP